MNNFIYNYEENSFYFLGSNTTPTYNRFDILSEETQYDKSGSECTPIFADYGCNNKCLTRYLLGKDLIFTPHVQFRP